VGGQLGEKFHRPRTSSVVAFPLPVETLFLFWWTTSGPSAARGVSQGSSRIGARTPNHSDHAAVSVAICPPNTPIKAERKIAPINAGTEQVNSAVTIFELSFMDLRLEKGLGASSQSFDARVSVTGSPVGPPPKCLLVATAFGFLFTGSRSMDV
jgi:hypothetical protein